ncbi:MAG: site-2 protease family protein [Planctomycetes bacterium]|nr:site-2 protease family protein [Planctomycetota bacterium]
MNWELAILWFVTFVISVTVHEAAHAWFAMLGGDRTAYNAGQVTLNPIPHMQREPFGMLVLPLLMLYLSNGTYCFGFAHAPIDPIWAYHHPKKAALMSAAGPLANLLLAAIAFTMLWFIARPDGETMVALRKIAGVFLFLNIVLFVFNLIPLPPLDGASVLTGLSRPARQFYDGLMRIPYMQLVILILLFSYAGRFILPVLWTVDDWLPYSLGAPPNAFR